jgi:hypothetical protein
MRPTISDFAISLELAQNPEKVPFQATAGCSVGIAVLLKLGGYAYCSRLFPCLRLAG